jgi:hypothetical protein
MVSSIYADSWKRPVPVGPTPGTASLLLWYSQFSSDWTCSSGWWRCTFDGVHVHLHSLVQGQEACTLLASVTKIFTDQALAGQLLGCKQHCI